MKNSFNWKTLLRLGFYGGIVTIYFSLIGMVEVFDSRFLIGDFFRLSHVIFYGGIIGAGIMATQNLKSENAVTKVLGSALAGLIAAILPALVYLFSTAVDARHIFVNLSPALNEFISFGRGAAGLGILFALSALLGAIVAGISLLPEKFQKPLTNTITWTLVAAIFSELVSQIMSTNFGRRSISLIFFQEAFKVVPVIIIFVALFGIFYFLHSRKKTTSTVTNDDPKSKRRKQIITFALVILAMAIAPWILGKFLSQVLFEVGRFVLLGLGLNIVVGYAGLLDLGYVAFFAFGAYTMGLLTTTSSLNMGNGFFNFWLAIPVAVLVSVIFGVILGFPVLRMRGDYLAIVTLGFGEIIRILALSDWLSPIMGGAQGILHIPNPVVFGFELDGPRTMYYLVVVGSALAAFISIRLRDSRLGRQWMAMREDEDVAEAMGINLVATKLLAFGIGAGFSGLAGAIFSARLSNIFPHSFNLLISVNALSLIIVGGLGSIPGVIVGAAVLVGLPELLREFQEYRLLMYGILLIIMMLKRPEGFIPAEVFKREFHKDEEFSENIPEGQD